MTAAIGLERRDHVATLTIDNQTQRNALTPGMLDELDEHLRMLAADGGTRVAVLQGAGGAFSSGYAIDRFPEPEDLPLEDGIEVLCKRIEEVPFVVVARIEGLCVGAALDVACACDVRYATADARLGITPAKLGLVYSLSGMRRVQRVAGRDAARRLLFSAELVRADSHIGSRLATEVVADAAALDEAVGAFASAVAANAPLSLSGTKQALALLDGPLGVDADEALAHHRRRQAAMASDDCAEARAAFAERRPARFTGR